MSWILPGVEAIPKGGSIRNVGEVDRATYARAYYHTTRKGRRKQTYTKAQKRRRYAQRRDYYYANLEAERANARARYWQNRDRYAAASRERARRRAAQRKGA